MKKLLVFACLGFLAGRSLLAAEVVSWEVERSGPSNDRTDFVRATISVDSQEEIFVEYFMYRERLANEPQDPAWIPIEFQGPPNMPRTALLGSQTIKNEMTNSVSRQAIWERALAVLAAPEQLGWSLYQYGIRITHPGIASDQPVVEYSPTFTLKGSEFLEAETDRLGMVVGIPRERLPSMELAPLGGGVAIADPGNVGDLAIPSAAQLDNRPFQQQAQVLKALEEEDKARAQRKALAQRVIAKTPIDKDSIYFYTTRPFAYGYKKGDPWQRQYAFEAGRRDNYSPSEAKYGWTYVHVPGPKRGRGDLGIKGRIPVFSRGDYFAVLPEHARLNDASFIDQIWSKDVLVYIHGFNVDFEEAITRAAQLKIDLKWKGIVIAVDWASRGLTAAYKEDREMVTFAPPNTNTKEIAKLMGMLAYPDLKRGHSLATRGKRSLIAHSMGNEVFNHTVSFLASVNFLPANLFENIIFAAPDVYIGDFRKMVDSLRQHGTAKQMTLYFSRRDIAVNLSRVVNLLSLWNLVSPRNVYEFLQGRAGITPQTYEGVDVINTDAINSTLGSLLGELGHGYYASADYVLDDIERLTSDPQFYRAAARLGKVLRVVPNTPINAPQYFLSP